MRSSERKRDAAFRAALKRQYRELGGRRVIVKSDGSVHIFVERIPGEDRHGLLFVGQLKELKQRLT